MRPKPARPTGKADATHWRFTRSTCARARAQVDRVKRQWVASALPVGRAGFGLILVLTGLAVPVVRVATVVAVSESGDGRLFPGVTLMGRFSAIGRFGDSV